MGEDSSQPLGLGEHVERAISDHVAKHAGEVATEKEALEAGKAERMQKGQALYDMLEKPFKIKEDYHYQNEKRWTRSWNDHDGLSPRTIQERLDGTRIQAGLSPGEECTNQAVRRSTMSDRYINDGPAINTYDGQPFSLPNEQDREAERHKFLRGLNLNVSISSHDAETDISNASSVFVARIIDPESLLVPRPQPKMEPHFTL